jgi:signal peptidase I
MSEPTEADDVVTIRKRTIVRVAVGFVVLALIGGAFALGRLTAAGHQDHQTTASAARSTLPFTVESGAMEPTLGPGDKIKVSPTHDPLKRGDIVVFSKPPNDTTPGVTDILKRVIGLPGERISAQNGHVYINGQELAEPWLASGVTTAPFPATYIPTGEYFMMGDNRGDSADSRIIGPIDGKLVIGVMVSH